MIIATLYRWFRVPWHKKDPSPLDVVRLISYPLLTSLCGTMTALNVMLFIRMNAKSFRDDIVCMSLGGAVMASTSFVLYILAIVFGNWIVVSLATLLHDLFFMLHIVVTVHILRSPFLKDKVNNKVLLSVRTLSALALILLTALTIRLALVSCALTDATFLDGKYWDVEYNKENNRNIRNQSNSSEM